MKKEIGQITIELEPGEYQYKEKGKKKEENEEKESLEEAEEIAKTEMTEEELGSDFSDDADKTVDVDEALSDLMNTKQYEFNTEEFKRIEEEDE